MPENEKPEKLIPFSEYDYFGYLSCGSILVVVIDFLRGGKLLEQDKISVPEGLFLVVAAYILGQIIAGPAHWLLERKLIANVLHRPNINLFSKRKLSIQSVFFHGYYEPFPGSIQHRIKAKAKVEGSENVGETLFLQVFSRVKQEEATMTRLNSFRNLYGFCRNVSFTCLLSSLTIAVWVQIFGGRSKLEWAAAALVISIGMFYRYLKFYQQYSYEMFISYLNLPDA